MKISKYIIYFVIIAVINLLFSSCSPSIPYTTIAGYHNDSLPPLSMTADSSTRVLLVFPHADDETIAAGLILHLKNQGANIHLLTLCEHDDVRTAELMCSAEKLGIQEVETANLVNNSWANIMADSIAFWYDQTDSIRNIIARKVVAFQPEVLITYDTQIGGYGHPEHRLSAKLTEDVFWSYSNSNEYSPTTLFQLTLTDELENFLVAAAPGYQEALIRNQVEGLPAPNASLDIRPYLDAKNSAGRCHTSQLDILERFHIVYEEKNREKHAAAFGREYYLVKKQ